jgi:hypothetical protein
MERIFDLSTLLAIFGGGTIFSALGFAVGLAYQPSTAAKRAGEAWLVSIVGGFLAHAFISTLLDIGDDSSGTGLLVGWAFFGVPGLFDSVARLATADPILTSPGVLLTIAATVGVVTGGLHGAYRIYPWQRAGVLQFVADVTWGLLGSTTGAVVHLYNCIFGKRLFPRSDDDGDLGERLGLVVFVKGFHVPGKDRFAFTQGPVVSNLVDDGYEPLFRHERVHVLQNRVFGPFYTLSYLAWMLIMFPVALVVGLVAPARPSATGNRVEGWCYFSNPWEVWGYIVQRRKAGQEINDPNEARRSNCSYCWPESAVIAATVPFLVVVVSFAAAVTF